MKHGLNKAEGNQETGLAPCPFCGNNGVKLECGSVECPECGAMGPDNTSISCLGWPDKPDENWNHRVQGSGKKQEDSGKDPLIDTSYTGQIATLRKAIAEIDTLPRDDTSPEVFWFAVKRIIKGIGLASSVAAKPETLSPQTNVVSNIPVNSERDNWKDITPDDATLAELHLIHLISGAKPDYLSNAQWRLNMRACAFDIRDYVAHVNNTQGMSGSGTESVAASTARAVPKKEEVVPHDCLQEKEGIAKELNELLINMRWDTSYGAGATMKKAVDQLMAGVVHPDTEKEG